MHFCSPAHSLCVALPLTEDPRLLGGETNTNFIQMPWIDYYGSISMRFMLTHWLLIEWLTLGSLRYPLSFGISQWDFSFIPYGQWKSYWQFFKLLQLVFDIYFECNSSCYDCMDECCNWCKDTAIPDNDVPGEIGLLHLYSQPSLYSWNCGLASSRGLWWRQSLFSFISI